MLDAHIEQFLVSQLQTPQIRHSGRTFFDHLKGTHDLLLKWGASKDVCHAGLFHSIYGTWHFQTQAFPIEHRHVIRDLIGEEAEFLAYVFCVCERPKQFLAHIGASEICLLDHHENKLLALSPQTLNQLLEIEAANLLEQGGTIERSLRKLLEAEISAPAKMAVRAYLTTALRAHEH